jgi:hypothetical protein
LQLTGCDATIGGLGLVAVEAFRSEAMAFEGLLGDAVEDVEDFKIASDASVYGYPLVTMAMTRRIITADEPEARDGRFARHRHPERVSWSRQGGQLAARAKGDVSADASALLAKRGQTLHHRRIVGDPAREKGRLIRTGPAGRGRPVRLRRPVPRSVPDEPAESTS